jgi:hypothetical protein
MLCGLIASDTMTARESQRRASIAVPRTADGHIDPQGVYDVATLTPLERPRGVAATLTLEEAAGVERRNSDRIPRRGDERA